MILVIGGFAAGKRAWVQAHLGYGAHQCSRNLEDRCPVLYDLQDLEVEELAQLAHKAVVICNEVGCGLVPVESAQREARERTGRLCIALAQEAQAVVRVVCGVGSVLRGQLPDAQVL